MKKTFRFFCLAITMLLLCSLTLTSCHGKNDRTSFEVPEQFDENAEYRITFWAKNDTNVYQKRIYEKAIEDFEQIYPNIKVTIKSYTDYNEIYNEVIKNIATETTPNVCITYPDHIATYQTGQNVVVPLNELMENAKYGFGGTEVRFDSVKADEMIPAYLDECQLGDQYYAIPFMRSTECLYINTMLVENLGYTVPDVVTWDFIWEVSEAAVSRKNADGTYVANGKKSIVPFIYKSSDNMMIQMLKQLGADYSNSKGDILIFNDTTRELLESVYAHGKSGAFSTHKISSYPANRLNKAECIFAVDSSAGSTWMGSDAPLLDIAKEDVIQFETAVRMVPQFDPEHPQMISQGPSICVFNKKDPQEVLASWLFAQFLLTNDVQASYSQTEGYAPVTFKARNSAEYQDYLSRSGEDNNAHYSVKIDATKLLLAHTDDTFITPVFNGSVSLRNAASQMAEEVLKSALRKETLDDSYFENLKKKMNTLYHLEDFTNDSGKVKLGALPTGSIVLLVSLGIIWVFLGLSALIKWRKNKRKIG